MFRNSRGGGIPSISFLGAIQSYEECEGKKSRSPLFLFYSRMKTVRFSKIVQAVGKPESHLLLVAPEKDSELRKALKNHRVMTLFQQTVGNEAEHGVVGFEKGTARQYLVFPRSLRSFEGRRVVGIKYDLLDSKPIPKSQQAPRPRPPAKTQKRKRHTTDDEDKPKNIVPFAKNESRHEPEEEEENPELERLKAQVRRAMAALESGKQVAAFNLLKQIVE